MTEKIKVHPGIGASAFNAAEYPAVEFAGGGKVLDEEREVKRGSAHLAAFHLPAFHFPRATSGLNPSRPRGGKSSVRPFSALM